MTILGFAGRWPESIDVPAQSRYLQAGASAAHERGSGQSAQVVAPSQHAAAGILVAVRGSPAWSPGSSQSGPATAASIHSAYSSTGVRFLERLVGTFALAIVDETSARVLLAIDRMGVERMAWARVGDALLFGSSAQAVARFPALAAPLRQQGLYDFLMMHMIPAPATLYAGVSKLRPATVLCMERGKIDVRPYWQPVFNESRPEPFEMLRDELHAALDQAVLDCRPDATTGSFLSGGLDSSTVSGKLGQLTASPARTFSMGFGVGKYDELEYADIANRRFGTRPFQYHVTPEDVVSAFPQIAQAYDEPFGNSSAVPTYICALRAREQGITHLLAGDGGDEIFGGNERYARHRVFDLYYRVPRLLRRQVLERLAPHLPGEGGWRPLSKLRSYVEQARIPLPERLESWNFIYREGNAMLEPEFAAAVDPRAPFATMSEVYAAAPCKSTLNKMLYYDWHYTLADSDLRKVGTMCELAGVRVSYPMLDARVVDLSNRVTPGQKMRKLELRSFYKDAMRGFLPEEILRKVKHGFGLPFGEWLQTHAGLADLIYSYLSDLKTRRIVRGRFIDDLIASQKTGHASYYGYAVWDLAMLEAWLQHHQRPA
jgi:asparagine synthase (glutamine-hydrolysing)